MAISNPKRLRNIRAAKKTPLLNDREPGVYFVGWRDGPIKIGYLRGMALEMGEERVDLFLSALLEESCG